MKCIWCKGKREIKLIGKGWIPCLNCHGTGEGVDGGHTLQVGTRPWMKGNKNQSSRRNENDYT